jgi:protein TonB
MAKVTPPRVTSSPHRQAEAAAGNAESEVEKKVFGDRKFYSMTLNMPNLNSAGGSWIIHFAEQGEEQSKSEGALAAPTVTAVSDPAYPLELMKQHVQGTVTLYAVIGTDGAVSNVRVLNGIDDRLDQYACEALGRWHFRPASKNGNPVALEAVVKIPFHPVKMRPSF